MHDQLWAGVELKLENAAFHLDRMSRALQAPERTGHSVVETSGAIIGHDWHRPFYAHLDAFLSAAKSVGQVIKCCFGVDLDRRLAPFNALQIDERKRREAFQWQFARYLRTFDQMPLSASRHISEHRSGYPPVTVTTTGLFGVTYEGDPLTRIPASETRTNEPGLPVGTPSGHLPVRPSWQDFEIDGRPLFAECQAYLEAAQRLIVEAQRIAAQVHGTKALTARW